MGLIDADALKKSIPTTYVDAFENCRNCSLLTEDDVRQLIDKSPTVGDCSSANNKQDILAPTQKQEEYAKYLAKRMCVELPKEYTKQAYSDFISYWKPIVQHEDDGMNQPSKWQLNYL